MTITIKNLGQVAPLATTETDLYTVPAATSAVASSLICCNRGNVSTTFRVSVAVGGGVTQTKDYIYYDLAIPANDTFIATVGLTLNAGDVVRVYAGNTNMSFTLSGEENT